MSSSSLDERRGLPSASGFGRLAVCPGSFMMERGCPDEVSEAANEGTMLHAYMEYLLNMREGEPEGMTDEGRELCRRAGVLLDGVKGRIEQDRGECAMVCVSAEERRFIYDWIDGDVGFSGQWDALFDVSTITGEEHYLLVVDWKFGRVEVSCAEANRQLQALVALVADKAQEEGMPYNGIYAAVVQPRLSGDASVAYYSVEDVERAFNEAMAIAGEALSVDAGRYASAEGCRYCKARAICDKAQAQLAEVSRLAVEADKWKLYTAEEKVVLFKLANMAIKVAEQIKYRFEKDVVEDLIPGYGMSKGKSAFTITDAQEAYGLLGMALGITAEEFTLCCKVGMTGLDKLVHDKRKAMDAKATVKESREWVREALRSCGEVKVSKGCVVEL